MSTLSNLIFKNKEHRVSSAFGPRSVIQTSAGATSSFHNGVDYATGGKKISQYAIADGKITSAGIDSNYGNAKYVWVEYPTLGVKMLHYHLDTIAVKSGQTVKKGDKLGTTGMTGKATGIHLHLGLKKIGGNDWMDAEAWSKNVLDAKTTTSKTTKVKTTARLNCRKAAGTSNAIVKVYEKGVVVAISSTTTVGGVKWGKTQDGWICLKYTESVK